MLTGASPLQLHTPLVGPILPGGIEDCYVRGNDLVARYLRRPQSTVAPQIYWRAISAESIRAFGVEAIVSMQTDLLDSTPRSWVQSKLPPGEYWRSEKLDATMFEPLTQVHTIVRAPVQCNLTVARWARWNLAFAELVHPDDCVVTEYALLGESLTIASALCHERLEKGVIRRARICGWFMPAENDLETAVELARQFVDEPLPLTA